MESTLDACQAESGDVAMAESDWLDRVWLGDKAIEGINILTTLYLDINYSHQKRSPSHSQYLQAVFWAMKERTTFEPTAGTWFDEHANLQNSLVTGDVLQEALEEARTRNSYAIVVARKRLA